MAVGMSQREELELSWSSTTGTVPNKFIEFMSSTVFLLSSVQVILVVPEYETGSLKRASR